MPALYTHGAARGEAWTRDGVAHVNPVSEHVMANIIAKEAASDSDVDDDASDATMLDQLALEPGAAKHNFSGYALCTAATPASGKSPSLKQSRTRSYGERPRWQRLRGLQPRPSNAGRCCLLWTSCVGITTFVLALGTYRRHEHASNSESALYAASGAASTPLAEALLPQPSSPPPS